MKMHWNQNNFNFQTTHMYNTKNQINSPLQYFPYTSTSQKSLLSKKIVYQPQNVYNFKRVKTFLPVSFKIKKRLIKSLYIRNFIDKIVYQVFKTPKKIEEEQEITSKCSLADNLNETETTDPDNSTSSIIRPYMNKLNNLQLEIKSIYENAGRLDNSLQFKCNQGQSNEMIIEYETFKKRNIQQLKNLDNEFFNSKQSSKFSGLILKFLLDILTKNDLKNINAKESYLFQGFLVNRFFRGIKTRIFKKIEKTKSFQDMTSMWNFPYNKEPQNISSSISILERISYTFSINLWYSSSSLMSKTKIFDKHFITSFKELKSKNLRNLYRETCIKIHRLTCFLILKIIVTRFNKTQVVYDDIECLEDNVCLIIEKFITSLLYLKSGEISNKTQEDEQPIDKTFILFNRMFETGDENDFYSMTRYIKFREMREYLGRKKKSRFVRNRRNDKKLKKI